MQSVTLKMFRYSEMCAHPQVCLKGTCYLITREHYVELFDLEDEALLGFMKEVQVAARVLKEVTGAFKINYEMHGNTAPHLHLHLFPRYLDDPLVEALSRKEDQVLAMCLVAMFIFSALGGAWFPLDVAGKAFATRGSSRPPPAGYQ